MSWQRFLSAAAFATILVAPTAARAQQRNAPELKPVTPVVQPDTANVRRVPPVRSEGGSNPWLIGAGAVVGAAAGGAIGCAINSDDYGVYCGGQSDTTVFVSAAIGAVIGGLTVWLLTRH